MLLKLLHFLQRPLDSVAGSATIGCKVIEKGVKVKTLRTQPYYDGIKPGDDEVQSRFVNPTVGAIHKMPEGPDKELRFQNWIICIQNGSFLPSNKFIKQELERTRA